MSVINREEIMSAFGITPTWQEIRKVIPGSGSFPNPSGTLPLWKKIVNFGRQFEKIRFISPVYDLNMTDNYNIRSNNLNEKEKEFENALRPLTFQTFSGQDKIVENLKVFVTAARMRTESLDHVLLHGPPGLGKNYFIQHHCQRTKRRV